MSAGYLLDTVVLSALAPTRRVEEDASKRRVRTWIAANAGALFLPVTAVMEVTLGIAEREAAGATRHAADLAAWLAATLDAFPDRILPLTPTDALHGRVLGVEARRRGMAPGFADLTVACIARAHDLTVATRNVRHFAPMGVPVLDPFASPGTG